MPDEIIYPLAVDVEIDKIYHWCKCGKTTTHPFCDKADCKEGVAYTATLNETLYFCVCKRTKNPPFCDGSHAKKREP